MITHEGNFAPEPGSDPSLILLEGFEEASAAQFRDLRRQYDGLLAVTDEQSATAAAAGSKEELEMREDGWHLNGVFVFAGTDEHGQDYSFFRRAGTAPDQLHDTYVLYNDQETGAPAVEHETARPIPGDASRRVRVERSTSYLAPGIPGYYENIVGEYSRDGELTEHSAVTRNMSPLLGGGAQQLIADLAALRAQIVPGVRETNPPRAGSRKKRFTWMGKLTSYLVETADPDNA